MFKMLTPLEAKKEELRQRIATLNTELLRETTPAGYNLRLELKTAEDLLKRLEERNLPRIDN